MSTTKISNVELALFRRFLIAVGCVSEGINGGHEKWKKEGLTRPIIIQTHINPVPAFIVRNTLRNLGITPQEYFEKIKDL